MSLVVESPPVPLRVDTHGVWRIGNTRVRLDTVITAWTQGASPEEIVDNFDTLKLADVYNVISYYLTHRSEVDRYLEQNQLTGEQIRAKIQPSRQTGIRERLLARRAALLNKEN